MNIVLGTGRCGTKSMAEMLDGKHELKPWFPWEKDLSIFRGHVKKMRTADYDTYVALFYLRYLDEFFEEFDDLNAICLKRDKEDVIDSFIKVSGGRLPEGKEYHRWTDHDGEKYWVDYWDKVFPSFEGTKRECIGKYWEKYYEIAEQYTDNPNFQIMDMNYALNTEEGQQEVFEFFNKDYPGFQDVHEHT